MTAVTELHFALQIQTEFCIYGTSCWESITDEWRDFFFICLLRLIFSYVYSTGQ